MSNIFDYMNWRDIPIKQVPFNEIDNLILSRLSYFPLDGIVENKPITLQEAYNKYKTLGTTGRILQAEDIDFFPKIANSKRFGETKLVYYINKIDSKQEKQFSAITILLPDKTIYIAYRGTDDTVIGWKEDFNMCFSALVPAQTDAVAYVNKIAPKYNRKIRIGGHSKGGNLAVYAASFCEPKIQNRIIQVYNNDGPGFHENVVQSKEYKKILPFIHTYIPQTSIIGRLLEHQENTTILKSTQSGIMQHDLYTWQVLGDKFVTTTLTNSSEYIDKTITNWLQEVDQEQRAKFIDTFFEILGQTKIEMLCEFKDKKFTNALTMIKTYQSMDDKTKEIMLKTINVFLKVAGKNIPKPKIQMKRKIKSVE